MPVSEPRNMQGVRQCYKMVLLFLLEREALFNDHTHTALSLLQLPYSEWSQSLKLISRDSDAPPGLTFAYGYLDLSARLCGWVIF